MRALGVYSSSGAGLAGPELLDGQRRLDPLALGPGHRAAQSRPARKLISPFPASQRPVSGLSAPGWTHSFDPSRPSTSRISLLGGNIFTSSNFSLNLSSCCSHRIVLITVHSRDNSAMCPVETV